ncbi:hypothetical protein [Streptomyces sasae]|uniref:hypothetical protein n=1 Tax=Streptomyces sasae TaxID=1266772 RepID=UPI00292F372B|nr:hypothetical protein [Streptomyces sasae]
MGGLHALGQAGNRLEAAVRVLVQARGQGLLVDAVEGGWYVLGFQQIVRPTSAGRYALVSEPYDRGSLGMMAGMMATVNVRP